MRRFLGVSVLIAAAACSDGSTAIVPRVDHDAGNGADADVRVPAPSWSHLPPVANPDPELTRLPSREAQYDKLCAQNRGDAFFKQICGGFRPNIADLAGLVRLAGLDQNSAFALTGNSTSLVARSVSALNPRIIVFPRVPDTLEPPKELITIGFVRGEQFVEVASRDPSTKELNFYLLSFERACSYGGSCDLASLLTEEIEHEWTAYSIYSEKDLEPTSFDCHACHQPAGFGTPNILRMQELTSHWLHWFPQRFVQRTDSDRILTAQFLSIHDVDGQYGGVPIKTIANALGDGGGAELEALIRAEGYADQPNVFDPRIEGEAKDGQVSATWLAQFQIALRGEAITVPYPRVDVTDETKRAAAVNSYRDMVTGAAPRGSLVDIRDLFSQDAIEKLGFVPQPGADGRSVLLQMCSRCHDGRANPDISRGRFNVQKLDQMSRDEKDVAIDRLQQPATSWSTMPPWRSGHLPDEAIQAAIQELRK
jgi:Cytochrome C oxidase, cbb3-type, subunit III